MPALNCFNTNLPFELDTPVYDIIMFKWIAEDNSFEVYMNIIDKKCNIDITDGKKFVPFYKRATLYLPEHDSDIDDGYQSPSALFYMGPSGIEWASASMRKCKGLPKGARMCYQSEYDEYIWKRIESGELPKSDKYFYNWAVWDAYLEYRKAEIATEEVVDYVFRTRISNGSDTITDNINSQCSSNADTEPETDDE